MNVKSQSELDIGGRETCLIHSDPLTCTPNPTILKLWGGQEAGLGTGGLWTQIAD